MNPIIEFLGEKRIPQECAQIHAVNSLLVCKFSEAETMLLFCAGLKTEKVTFPLVRQKKATAWLSNRGGLTLLCLTAEVLHRNRLCERKVCAAAALCRNTRAHLRPLTCLLFLNLKELTSYNPA